MPFVLSTIISIILKRAQHAVWCAIENASGQDGFAMGQNDGHLGLEYYSGCLYRFDLFSRFVGVPGLVTVTTHHPVSVYLCK